MNDVKFTLNTVNARTRERDYYIIRNFFSIMTWKSPNSAVTIPSVNPILTYQREQRNDKKEYNQPVRTSAISIVSSLPNKISKLIFDGLLNPCPNPPGIDVYHYHNQFIRTSVKIPTVKREDRDEERERERERGNLPEKLFVVPLTVE
jgi:hypothetical protein